MFKDINTLLTEKTTEEERRKELLTLLPNLEKGEKIYYNKDCYLFLKENDLFNGMDKYPQPSIVKGKFPYIFLLSAVYNALNFAEQATKYQAFLKNKKFKKTKEGFISHSELGIIADNYLIKEFLNEFKEKEDEDEKLVEEAITEAVKEVIIEETVEEIVVKEKKSSKKKTKKIEKNS